MPFHIGLQIFAKSICFDHNSSVCRYFMGKINEIISNGCSNRANISVGMFRCDSPTISNFMMCNQMKMNAKFNMRQHDTRSTSTSIQF